MGVPAARNLVKSFPTSANTGLSDATHIRFFTLAEIGKLFAGLGYATEHMVGILNVEVFREGSWPRDLDFGNELLRNVTRDQAQQLYVSQYLIRARKNPPNGTGGRP